MIRAGIFLAIALCGCAGAQKIEDTDYAMHANFVSLPTGMTNIGLSHGDVAVAPNGEIYVSVEGGDRPGLQVYSNDGRYLRNLPDAPNDLHGFVIANTPDGQARIFAASLNGQKVLRMTLDGEVDLEIPASSFPDDYKATGEDTQPLSLTGVDVAPNGDIYVVDGYGLDYIHRFDSQGQYISTFGGRVAPWDFENCHQIAIDKRFDPARVLCTDRRHGRIVQMALDGSVIGTVAEDLGFPSALAVYDDKLAVGELDGRVTILDKSGNVIDRIGENTDPKKRRTSMVPPEEWSADLFYSPHGVAYDSDGNLFVAEWSRWGRVSRLDHARR